MPIRTSVGIEVFDQEEYHKVDRRVTGFAFDIHNQFGRFLDEGLYQTELARRCKDVGFDVTTELQITAQFEDFSKYATHTGQTLNYLYLCGLNHATLINFRKAMVEHEFVSTGLTLANRLQFEISQRHWKPSTDACERMVQILSRVLREWGTHLDPLLYRDALIHFLGGKEQVARRVPVFSAGIPIGTKEMYLLADNIAFSVTASIHNLNSIWEHQKRFIKNTQLHSPLDQPASQPSRTANNRKHLNRFELEKS